MDKVVYYCRKTSKTLRLEWTYMNFIRFVLCVFSYRKTWKTAISICLTSRFPMVLFVGPKFVKIYNDAYIPIMSGGIFETLFPLKYEGRHPRFFGETSAECWQGTIKLTKD